MLSIFNVSRRLKYGLSRCIKIKILTLTLDLFIQKKEPLQNALLVVYKY